ncbi:MAG: 50S ribosomal protein L4 [Candidatus Marinimicrobia bacterium]|nr:50S ribosomal protein L4 [Candidatus Neomarinimicrobiota bacterium]
MNWTRQISKEVKELGAEILTYHEEIEVKEIPFSTIKKITCYEFRGIEVFRKDVNDKVRILNGFCALNKKEERYLHDCFARGYMKKITFLPWQVDRNVMLSLRNIPNVSLVRAKQVSTIDLLDCDVLLFEKKGIKELNEQLLVN